MYYCFLKYVVFRCTSACYKNYAFLETDTKFGGVTAFPESSTIVTGLKYKNKYKGHEQKIRFPHL